MAKQSKQLPFCAYYILYPLLKLVMELYPLVFKVSEAEQPFLHIFLRSTQKSSWLMLIYLSMQKLEFIWLGECTHLERI